LDESFPEYGFAKHKGYGTAFHLNKINELGPSPVHRKSFFPVRDLSQSPDLLDTQQISLLKSIRR